MRVRLGQPGRLREGQPARRDRDILDRFGWDAIIGQWTAEVTAAQSAFDAAESHWALPAYTLGT